MIPTGGALAVVSRGARVNAVGVAARAAQPLAFVLLTRWYGPDDMGIYLLALAALETIAALATGGVQDGVVAFLSPLEPDSDQAYRTLASAFVMAMAAAAIGAIAAAAAALAAPGWLQQPGTGPALLRMAPALPLVAIVSIVVAATRARFEQAYGVLLQGAAKPVLIIVFGLLLSLTDHPGVTSLAWAYVLSHVVLSVCAVFILGRYLALPRLVAAIRKWPFERRLAAFAIPQNLNLALYSLSGSASVLALGVAGLPSRQIALYATALGIAASLRQVRLVFSSALAPVVASLHAHERRDDLQEVMERTVAWSLLIAIPVALLIVWFRDDVLRLFHPSYRIDATTMVLLVIAPLLNSVAGVASNILIMAGFVRWNLMNTAAAVTATFGLTWLLVPAFGLGGAAAAGAAAGLLVAALQLGEARVLLNIPLPLRSVGRALLPGTCACLVWLAAAAVQPAGTVRVVAAGLALTAYAGAVLASRRHPRPQVTAGVVPNEPTEV